MNHVFYKENKIILITLKEMLKVAMTHFFYFFFSFFFFLQTEIFFFKIDSTVELLKLF